MYKITKGFTSLSSIGNKLPFINVVIIIINIQGRQNVFLDIFNSVLHKFLEIRNSVTVLHDADVLVIVLYDPDVQNYDPYHCSVWC